MTKEITVLKRDGSKELLDLEKMHNVVFYACEGITGVSPSEVEIKSHIQFYNGITSDEIQETLIKAAADLINGDTPNYQWVAGRLINYHLRKEVYGQFEPFHLTDVARKNVDLGYYDPQFFEKYTAEEIEKLNSLIKHDRDENIAYVGMEQFRGKYLVQNRVTGAIYETPQIAYMMMSATLFQDYPKNTRMKYIKEMYDAVSNFDLSLPTPIMAGVRTPQRQFSSCVLIETDDSLDSINATSSSIVKYVSQKAGIGIGAGSIRAIGSPIRQGDASHTGVIPFYKMFQSAVKSCSQGGVRGGAATLHYPIWHLEVEDLLVLKNNKGTEDNRVRHLDYSVQFNKLMYERLLTGGNITLFSPADVPGLYDAFFNDQDEFRRLYETAERNTKLRKQVIPASDLFSTFMEERKNTGRVYLQNVDHANTHSSFDEKLAPIHMSNLCQEITLPTKPLNDLNDPNGEISLCTLAAVNWGNIKTVAEFERVCRLAVRALDELLDYQKYPVLAAELSTMKRRPLGIGIINFAYWLAKNDTNYQNPNLELIDEWTEAWSYYLIKASADLAIEKGNIEGIGETKYGQGITPNQTYKKELDELIPHVERMPWDELRKQLKETGIRNSTLMALMPAETSAQISNSTNGIEPPRSLVSVKQSKHGVLKQVVPEYRRLQNKYDLLWDQRSPEGYLKIMAVLQKYIDQAISVNTSYNPEFYEDEKIPMSTMLQHLLMFYKYGGKQLYYFNTFDGQGEMDFSVKDGELAAGALDDDDCESCKI
ncbi:ribonucleoside-diphosphate reductase subunit alpha [bacterium]|nr:ribonucleoside-diphosphate reductase subunit alpha [bacterium]MDB4128537.1 ribonucleoside-diphosphate reductase subunit alpha [bacterium]